MDHSPVLLDSTLVRPDLADQLGKQAKQWLGVTVVRTPARSDCLWTVRL